MNKNEMGSADRLNLIVSRPFGDIRPEKQRRSGFWR